MTTGSIKDPTLEATWTKVFEGLSIRGIMVIARKPSLILYRKFIGPVKIQAIVHGGSDPRTFIISSKNLTVTHD
jgi:hypothetical protein